MSGGSLLKGNPFQESIRDATSQMGQIDIVRLIPIVILSLEVNGLYLIVTT